MDFVREVLHTLLQGVSAFQAFNVISDKGIILDWLTWNFWELRRRQKHNSELHGNAMMQAACEDGLHFIKKCRESVILIIQLEEEGGVTRCNKPWF